MENDNFRINIEKSQFEMEVDGNVAYLTFEDVDGVWYLPHTVVPSAIGGRGIASSLVSKSLDYLLEIGIKYVPICSFVVAFVSKNPEYTIGLK